MALILGSFIFWRETVINNLEKTIISKENTISLQDNKIKEQLSTINLLEENSKNLNTSIEALQLQLSESKINCNELLGNLNKLHEISAAGKECPLPKPIIKEVEKVVIQEVPIILNQECPTVNNSNEEEIHVVDQETSNKFINLRNGIITKYK